MQLSRAGRVPVADPGDASGHIGLEIGVAVAVLLGQPRPDRVVQQGPKGVVLLPRHGRRGVHHETGQPLPVGRAADAGLGGVDPEALVGHDLGDALHQLGGGGRADVTGEREIVCVARVLGGVRLRQPGEARIEPEGAQIRQRRRCRRSLRQMWRA